MVACKGRDFRPSPSCVDEATKAVLYEQAGRALDESAKMVDWGPGEIEAWSMLPPKERLESGRRQWAQHFSIPWDSYLACKDDIDKARLLPMWDCMEPNRSQPSQLRLLAESIFEQLPAVRDTQGGHA